MIIRTPNRDRFTIISKVPLEDTRLSWKARGLHAYLMSKPDSWQVILAHLVKQAPDGKASVTSGLAELEEAGYIRRTTRHDDAGRFDGVDCEVFEEPQPENRVTVTATRKTVSGKTVSGKSAPSEDLEVVKTDLTLLSQPKVATTKKPYSDEFEAVWAIYPRKTNKAGAYKAFTATIRKGANPKDLTRAVENYAVYRQGEPESFTLHAATFFGPNERWRDYLGLISVTGPIVPANAVNDLRRVHETTQRSREREEADKRAREEAAPMPDELRRLAKRGRK